MDRRIEKSKQAIMNAFTQLMLEKDIGKITINKIADRANVNRGTIYLHFAEIFDLLNHCIESHLSKLFENCPPKGTLHNSSKDSLLRTFEYLEQHALFYSKMLTDKSSSTFRNRLQALTRESIEKQIYMNGINKDMNKEILVQYFTSATIGVVEWWIINSMSYSSTYMAEQFWSLLERAKNARNPWD